MAKINLRKQDETDRSAKLIDQVRFENFNNPIENTDVLHITYNSKLVMGHKNYLQKIYIDMNNKSYVQVTVKYESSV